MDPRILALKLFLMGLEVPAGIATVTERKRLQKAVYLGQLSGVDLGYRFSWYLMGPYSPRLARDYYQLSEDAGQESQADEGKQLRADASEKLNRIKGILTVPPEIPLEQDDWLELLASYDFLRRKSGYSHDMAVELLRKEKAHVVDHASEALDALRAHSLCDYA